MTTDVITQSTTTVRAGIVGGGFMARVHAAAIRDAGGVVAAIATRTAESAMTAADAVRAERAEPTASSLAHAADIDVVHVCTPNTSHATLALSAIQAHKHVVCEKPLAVSADEARGLVAAATQAGLVATVPFIYRYHPQVREARARVQQGALGSIVTIDAAYLQDWMLTPEDDDWRTQSRDGGPTRAFGDIGSHLCDLLEFITGDRIARLSARTRRVYTERAGRSVDTEDLAAVVIETQGGVLGTLLVSQMAAGRKNALTIEVHGTTGAVRFDQERPEELWVGHRGASQLLLRDPQTAQPDAARLSRLPAGHAMGYQDAFNAFMTDTYAAISGGRPEGLPTFADGLRAALIAEAVLLSAGADGRWTEVAS